MSPNKQSYLFLKDLLSGILGHYDSEKDEKEMDKGEANNMTARPLHT